ncbi:Thioredoxin superfamily protein [Zea mays]|uniref:Thioredoxin superfamily protein n=1 Tax=Zea mays TaxID=4577 RepID=A0A1D6L317_MAIZE|nr:Thioredoxin superfamily protein [Zea mays]
MATAISFPRAPLVTPRACTPRRLVHVSAARASPPRGGGRVGRRSPTVPAVAGASSSSSGLAPDTSVPAWDALGGVSVLAAGTGNAVALTDLWDSAEGVAVVALLRHFGCFCCWELASVLKDAMAEFDSAGAKLIAIGVGTPEKARILADRLPFPMDSLYADPERMTAALLNAASFSQAYSVLGLYHGLGRTLFSPASAKIYSRLDYIKKATENYTLEGTPADLTGVLQQPRRAAVFPCSRAAPWPCTRAAPLPCTSVALLQLRRAALHPRRAALLPYCHVAPSPARCSCRSAPCFCCRHAASRRPHALLLPRRALLLLPPCHCSCRAAPCCRRRLPLPRTALLHSRIVPSPVQLAPQLHHPCTSRAAPPSRLRAAPAPALPRRYRSTRGTTRSAPPPPLPGAAAAPSPSGEAPPPPPSSPPSPPPVPRPPRPPAPPAARLGTARAASSPTPAARALVRLGRSGELGSAPAPATPAARAPDPARLGPAHAASSPTPAARLGLAPASPAPGSAASPARPRPRPFGSAPPASPVPRPPSPVSPPPRPPAPSGELPLRFNRPPGSTAPAPARPPAPPAPSRPASVVPPSYPCFAPPVCRVCPLAPPCLARIVSALDVALSSAQRAFGARPRARPAHGPDACATRSRHVKCGFARARARAAFWRSSSCSRRDA